MIVGQGLHGAAPSAVGFSRRPGPTALRRGAEEAPLEALVVVETTRSTTVATREGGLRIATVEHLFAALAAFGARRDVLVTLEGPEVPLADGGARAFADAIAALGVAPIPPSLRVVREGEVDVGESRYVFRTGTATALEVRVDFADERLARTARWEGDPEDFRARIATARTFGFEREVEDLLARGLAGHVAPESVVVIGRDRVLFAGHPFSADEPARHKLLDLAGDLFVHGGPPLGEIVATRPGHAATHEAVRLAFAGGLLASVSAP